MTDPMLQRHQGDSEPLVHLPAVVADQFGIPRSEARRRLALGRVKVNGEVVTEQDIPLPDAARVAIEMESRPLADSLVQMIVELAREELAGLEADPGTVLSPDGWGEREGAADLARQVLKIAEADKWCPPHHYSGQATMVRGECRLTCNLCGDSFVGTWDQEGYGERPPEAPAPCARCKGTGWSGGVPWARPNEPAPTGKLCEVCGGSSTSPPDAEKAQEVTERTRASASRAREMGFVTP